jgi:hypothetical protein
LEEKSYANKWFCACKRRIRYNQELYQLYWSQDIARTTKAAGCVDRAAAKNKKL